jgi:hypothetical protein
MRSCLEDTSVKVPANGWFSLFGPCRKSSARPEPVQFREPLVDVRNYWFEKDPFLNSAHSHPVAFKAEFLGEADGLAPAILEELCNFRPRHIPLVYINGIDPCKTVWR